MKSISAIALLAAAGALSACDDKVPKPKLETRPPATRGMTAPAPPPVEPPSASPAPTQPGDPTQAPYGPNK